MIFSLQLNSIDELFEQRHINPLRQPYLLESGVEHIFKKLRIDLPRELSTVVIYLPEDQGKSTSAVTVREALSRYCNYKIDEVRNDYAVLKREGLRSLPVGLFFLSACVVLAYLIQTREFLPALSQFFVVEGLYIIGWVSMWKPVEVFLYEWWPFRRRVRVYRYMSTMDIAIRLSKPIT